MSILAMRILANASSTPAAPCFSSTAWNPPTGRSTPKGFAVYRHEAAPLPYHRVAAHGWVTQHDQVIDIDYAVCGRYDVAYFPGQHWPDEAVYHRLKTEAPDIHHLAFGLMPMGLAMTRAYVAACDYMITTWPEEITDSDRQHLDEWRHNLRVLETSGHG
ncbi:MAG: hypothetical protein KDJ52_32060 [Anaerolineae bacterium]|nr:hypothetical protein [Anaerolineae bacterium]